MSAQDEANQAALEFACNSAAQLALLAVPDAPSLIINGVPGPPIPPGYHSPPGTKIFYNSPQICSVACPDASLFTFTCPPGRFIGASQAQADAAAKSYACQQAALRKVCPPATPCSITDATPLSPFDQGQPYTHQFTVTGGVPPFSWSIIAGTLPAGLSMNGNGLISGTASLINGNLDKTFTVKATDSSTPANTCSKAFTLPVLDYSSFPPGKHWRIQGYFDGMLNSSCCQVCGLCNVWPGTFINKVGAALFQGDASSGIANHVTTMLLRQTFTGTWGLQLFCATIPGNATWIGEKVGSNSGAKLDSPAGVYTFGDWFGYGTVCDMTASLTIEEY